MKVWIPKAPKLLKPGMGWTKTARKAGPGVKWAKKSGPMVGWAHTKGKGMKWAQKKGL